MDRLAEEDDCRFNENDAGYIVNQILSAINFMHTKKNNKPIVHRDLKLENILLDSDNKDDLHIKITDLGFTCLYDEKKGMDYNLGTLPYQAPELVKDGKPQYNEKVDIWSIGVMTYLLLSGCYPFSPEGSKKELIENIKT